MLIIIINLQNNKIRDNNKIIIITYNMEIIHNEIFIKLNQYLKNQFNQCNLIITVINTNNKITIKTNN